MKPTSKILAAGMSLVFVVASALPSQAFVPQMRGPLPASSNVIDVQARDVFPDTRDGNRTYRRYYRDGRPGYYNGYRGYRSYRRGYRRHNDFWFPLAAFGMGAIIGGAITNQGRPVYRAGNAHVNWCLNRYRSYRPRDNTFQPYNGPRRQCYSPYN